MIGDCGVCDAEDAADEDVVCGPCYDEVRRKLGRMSAERDKAVDALKAILARTNGMSLVVDVTGDRDAPLSEALSSCRSAAECITHIRTLCESIVGGAPVEREEPK